MCSAGESNELLERARGGDSDALGLLMSRHAVRLEGLMRRAARDIADGDVDLDDLVQETFEKAMTRWKDFEYRGPGSFYAWLAKLGRGVVGDRRKYRRGKGRGAVDRRANQELIDARARLETSVPGRAARREALERIGRALSNLDERERTTFELHFFEGKSFAEIGLELGVDRSTAFRSLERALLVVRGGARFDE
jgi:RNA polymerase sigma-70 factor, ECF subfamily